MSSDMLFKSMCSFRLCADRKEGRGCGWMLWHRLLQALVLRASDSQGLKM